MTRHRPIDAAGRTLRPGDVVRIVGIPDLSSLPAEDELGTRAVFAHLKGTYRRIRGFDELGHAHLELRIRAGEIAGLHSVWIEPYLLRKVVRRRRRAGGASRRRT